VFQRVPGLSLQYEADCEKIVYIIISKY
jgi:hypothetical protein